MAKLTVRKIEALQAKPAAAAKEFPDSDGLYFAVQPSGKAAWTLRYRFGGKPRKLTIGPYPALGLADARQAALQARAAVAAGKDPQGEKLASRAAARAAAHAPPAAPPKDLIEDVAAAYLKRHVEPKTRLRSAAETRRLFDVEILPQWRGRRLSEISKADVHALLDVIVDRGAPVTANRTLSALRGCCAWALSRGLIEFSPVAGVKAPAEESARERVLSDAELRAGPGGGGRARGGSGGVRPAFDPNWPTALGSRRNGMGGN